jgi:SpoVK/Ycf46/Vps4 family AAA+-type ATPase
LSLTFYSHKAQSQDATMAISRDSKGGKTNSEGPTNKDIALGVIVDLISICAVCAVSYGMSRFLSKYIQQQQLSTRPTNQEAKERLTRMLIDREKELLEENGESSVDEENIRERVARKVVTALELNEYESAIAEDVIDPNDITTSFRDVGGIDDIKAELFDLVVLPILRPDLFQSDSGLVSPPRGILLYGAPGTGKTMLAKAIAKERGATFVNVRLSSIMDKWFGESNKLVSATFSLAKKLAPSVIFIDEIDTFLNQRDSSEGSAATSMKSEFLTLWDGMLSDTKGSKPITVLGATNRPYDVDSAILRRLPRTFEIGLPDAKSRLQILELFLKKHELTEDARKMIPAIAAVTEGYSGSDLKELWYVLNSIDISLLSFSISEEPIFDTILKYSPLNILSNSRAAAMAPIREITKEASRQAVMGMQDSSDNTSGKKKKLVRKRSDFGPAPGVKVRPVCPADFKAALEKVKRTGETARDFRKSDENINSSDNSNAKQMGIDMNDLARAMQIFQMIMTGKMKNPPPQAADNLDEDIPFLN